MLVLPPLPQFDVQHHSFACRGVAWLCWNVAATNSLDPTWKPTMPGEHRHACRQGRNLAGVFVKIGVFFCPKMAHRRIRRHWEKGVWFTSNLTSNPVCFSSFHVISINFLARAKVAVAHFFPVINWPIGGTHNTSYHRWLVFSHYIKLDPTIIPAKNIYLVYKLYYLLWWISFG